MPAPDDAKPGAVSDLAAAYAELHDLLLERPDVDAFLQQVADLAAAVMPETSCGIVMRREQDIATVATSDDVAAGVDEVQYGRGQGPSLEAVRTGRIVSVVDLAQDERWAEYRIHALSHGVRSSLSLPLFVDGVAHGGLNLYATRPNRFGDVERARCEAFARQAAGVLTIVMRNADQIALEGQLRDALATRAVVDQAVGIVMGQCGVNAVEAFAVLRETSQNRNRRLRDVAVDLVTAVTGQPPIPPRPFADPR